MKDKILALRAKLNQASWDYHTLGTTVISDQEFDAGLRELQDLEKAYPEFADLNSPTARIGGISIDKFEKFQHRVPMLSLEKAFSAEEIVNFLKVDATVYVEPKFDGISVSLHYVDGQLAKAVTRGDGTTGDDITANVRTIRSVPLVLKHKLTCEIRGEAYLSKVNFVKLNERAAQLGEEPFANARNAAAGTLKQKDAKEVAARNIDFVAYQFIGHNETAQDGIYVALNNEGFFTPATVAPSMCWFSGVNVDEIKTILKHAENRRAEVPMDIDGLVIKVNKLEIQNSLGFARTFPKWAVAYKFPAEQKTTTLTGVTLQVGRLGTITPVAELKPVNLAGTVVKRASLCNADEIARLGVQIGDEVVVEKAGDIIPRICSVSEKKSAVVWAYPAVCPCCSTALVRNGVHYFCPNKTGCADQIYERLQHAVGKSSLDWDGMGEANLKMLIKSGVQKFSDLLKLNLDQVAGAKPAFKKKFLAERERIKTAPLWRKLHALGIDGIGVSSSKELANRWKSLSDMLDAGQEELAKVVGPVSAGNFVAYTDTFGDELVELVEHGMLFEENAERAGGSLFGKIFVITGAMISGSREEVSERIEKAGGTVKGSVGRKCQFLVKGDGAGATKSREAEKYGVKVITEVELFEMMGQTLAPSAGIENSEFIDFPV